MTLRALIALHGQYAPGTAERRVELLRALGKRPLRAAKDVVALHEELCFLRAHPDDGAVLARTVALLDAFATRPDLARHRARLADSGIAGTALRYRFFEPTATWLAGRFPRSLDLTWDDAEAAQAPAEKLDALLPYLLPWAESCGLDARGLDARELIDALRAAGESDAGFLLRRIAALEAAPEVRRYLYEALDLELVLRPGRGTPSRTTAVHAVPVIAWRTAPLRRDRPDLAREIRRPPRAIRELSRREARALVQLARDAMVVRSRDLDAFMAADARDARWVDCGDGLALACFGVLPRERLLLESVYAILMLRNGVPIGYVLSSALFGSAEIAFNVFETFRGGESAWIYARVLAAVRVLFGAETFTVPPYQLGHHNEEGLLSGAWWFYEKLGFAPRDRGARALRRAERARSAARPRHRSSRRVLERLVQHDLVFPPDGARGDAIGFFPAGRVSAAVSRRLRARGGADREAGVRASVTEVARALGVRRLTGWTGDERAAFARWAPLLCLLPDLARWPAADRRALLAVVRAKGGRRESEFVLRFDAHPRLRRALCGLARVRSSV